MPEPSHAMQADPFVEEELDLGIGPVDIVFALLTLPLLFWALMYAVSGHEQVYATRAGRMRLYLRLLAIEAVLVAATVWWIAR